MCGLNYCIVHTSDTWCFDQTRPTIYIYIDIYIYLHIYTYVYVYNTVVTRCPLWSFPYRIHTGIPYWDPHRIHTRIHIGIHTAIAKHKPGFVGQLTTTLWGFVCNQKLGFRTSVEDGPCTKHRRRRVLANRHSFDENSYPSCFHSVQCNHETPRTTSKAQSGEVQDCPAPAMHVSCHSNLDCHQWSGAHCNRCPDLRARTPAFYICMLEDKPFI